MVENIKQKLHKIEAFMKPRLLIGLLIFRYIDTLVNFAESNKRIAALKTQSNTLGDTKREIPNRNTKREIPNRDTK